MRSIIFLGGSCNPTTWRHDVAIPALEQAGVRYYNPQVEDWSPALVEVEAQAKKEAEVLLFVIDGQTRAIASMIEVSEYAALGRKIVVVIEEIPDGTTIDGQVITGRQLKDLNRGRDYVADVVKRGSNAHLAGSLVQALELAKSLL
jgi:raw